MSGLWEKIAFAQNGYQIILTWHRCCGEIIGKEVNDP